MAVKHIRHDRKKTLEGQLTPLSERLTAVQATQREETRNYRSEVAKQHAITRGIANACYGLLSRGFWGRFRWIFLGK